MPPQRPIKLRRSALITPGDDETLLQKAARSAADVCVIDWEDGVYATRKPAARDITARVLQNADWSEHEVMLRLNGMDTPYCEDDIRAAAALPVAGVRFPKIERLDEALRAVQLVAAAESGCRPGQWAPLDIWISIESAGALVAVDDIARCSPRLGALTFGGGDLGADLQVKRLMLGEGRPWGPMRFEYCYGQGRVVAAARANGLDVINMGYSSYKDLEGTRWDAEYAAQMGFSGCIALSVRQLETINKAFSPSADDLAWARKLLEDFNASTSESEKTVIVVNHEMADGPFVRNALRIVALQEAIEAREARRARQGARA